jgi:hypothetical protein
LYDQLLYLQAQCGFAVLHKEMHGSADHALQEKISRLYHLIRANYWFDGDADSRDAYHEVLHRKGHQAARHCADRHWLPAFSPSGYGYRFDALANILASLLNVADDNQRRQVDDFISEELIKKNSGLLPAFHPVIKPVDEDWEDLQLMFSYSFKNKPYEFHNGGLWPMVTGFYVADLANRGQKEKAEKFLLAVHQANALPMDGEPWSFPEYVHGQTYEAGGTRHLGWSAAAAIIGHHAVYGDHVFKITNVTGI